MSARCRSARPLATEDHCGARLPRRLWTEASSRAGRSLALWAMLVLLAPGCLGPIASLYPPAPDDPTVLVWVVDHGWHAGLVVARSSIPRGLWREQDDFPDAQYLEVGWGDADFYRARDPGVALAIRAALASRGSALHMAGLPMRPEEVFPGREVVEIRLSQPGFAALARFVDDGFDREGRGRALVLGAGLYGTSAPSAFYPARGHYHVLHTCNTWIALALRAAGVPITPVYAMTAGVLLWQVKRLREPAGAPAGDPSISAGGQRWRSEERSRWSLAQAPVSAGYRRAVGARRRPDRRQRARCPASAPSTPSRPRASREET